MDPAVEAAIIAGGVGVFTLLGTVGVQFYGIHRTSRDIQRAVARTLREQRTRTLNERFATAADKLGSDKPSAVRLAGVYAMAGLADDWAKNRQTCVDVLCAYLRLPYDPDPGDTATSAERTAYRANREVRQTIIRLITAHLCPGAPVSWQGVNLDFTRVVFDGGDFTGAQFSGGHVDFGGAEFSSGLVSFRAARFTGGEVSFYGANFSGGQVNFGDTEFSGAQVYFGAEFTGRDVSFFDAVLLSGTALSGAAEFSGGQVYFGGAKFVGGLVNFYGAKFSGAQVDFGAEFSGGQVDFRRAEFSGGQVDFGGAEFSGAQLSFLEPAAWSHPPTFGWDSPPPAGVTLPADTNTTS